MPLSHMVTIGAFLILICLGAEALARTKWGRLISAPAIILILAIGSASVGIVPQKHALYGQIYSYVVPAAIALLLAQANLRALWTHFRPMAFLFGLAAGATVIGGIATFYLLAHDTESYKLVSVFIATYIGGSLNFVTTAETVGLNETLKAPALAADSVIGLTYLLGLSIISGLISKNKTQDLADTADIDAPIGPEKPGLKEQLLSLPFAIAFAALVVSASYFLAKVTGKSDLLYLYLITIAVAFANLFPKAMARLTIAPFLGIAGMYLFFAIIGIITDLSALKGNIEINLSIAALIVGVHVIIFFPIGRLFGMKAPEMLTISNACILGPATAAAIASSRKWNHLIAPGTLCGVFGYVIANFIALAALRFFS